MGHTLAGTDISDEPLDMAPWSAKLQSRIMLLRAVLVPVSTSDSLVFGCVFAANTVCPRKAAVLQQLPQLHAELAKVGDSDIRAAPLIPSLFT